MSVMITFPDGSQRNYPAPVRAGQVALDISPRLAEAAIIAEIDGVLRDMDHLIDRDAHVRFHTFESDAGKDVYWHSTAHLMAQAVKQLFPQVKIAIGPAIENGFYYDFDREESFTDEELTAIENRMKELIALALSYQRRELSKAEAIERFGVLNETFKLEILSEIPEGDTISTYQQSDFIDLCRGPHILDTGRIKAFKLLKTSGAYWRGDEKNKMLKRIYGISFPSNKQLNEYLRFLEEAKLRDHRKIGKDLDLFSINDEVGPGLVLWHPNGAMIRHLIEQYWKDEHIAHGYKLIYTPHIGRAHLWQTSGHLGYYKESMYAAMEVEGQDYYIKPMNCPFHLSMYNTNLHSYRELPIRLGELGTVYRYERSGVLHGLMRVRGFTQDDAHIICTPEQLDDEVKDLILFAFEMLRHFGFDQFMVYLSTMPDAAVGDTKDWDTATESLRQALETLGIEYQVEQGGGAFYGPKIDIKIKDALNRAWQCTTIQFDFNLPERFDMTYVGADNAQHRPYVIHRAILGSVERFFGTLLEFHSGNLPLWLCPVQVMILPITDSQIDYARQIQKQFLRNGLRVECDLRSEKIGYKIREAEIKKIPFMCIVGKNETESGNVTLRRHTKGDFGVMDMDRALQTIKSEI